VQTCRTKKKNEASGLLDEAEKCVRASLECLSIENRPDEWATATNQLGQILFAKGKTMLVWC
jgi:hypothetical protein